MLCHVIEVVEDAELRIAEGEIGIQIDLELKAGDRHRLDKDYDDIMKVLGENADDLARIRKVQTKLMLPEAVYRLLKRAAAEKYSTTWGLVGSRFSFKAGKNSGALNF
jgi:hypothetical protein